MVQPLWRTLWRFLKKLKIELPYDPAIPLLGIYPEKTVILKGTCTSVFIVALFTMAKTWKQPKCPSTDEWIKKMCHIYIYIWNITTYYYTFHIYGIYIYNGILLSHEKKNEIMPFAATWVDLEMIILSEVS